MRLGLIPILEVEAEVIYEGNGTLPLSGQMFYVLEKSASDIIPLIDADHEKAIEQLKSRAIKFIITDSQGKVVVKDLKAKTYYICGISRTHQGVGVWNVRVDMQYGKNSLVLDNKNMTAKP
ncbi:MAG TPA: hypothetical protein VGO50_04575 [Pyrinomonadaceae bacterium]|jgi:hypothetical protein|nr:hypothetical protein [Pyrinomonadaceae bacterium]